MRPSYPSSIIGRRMVMARRFQDVWEDQCKAAEGIAARFGTVQALDYL